MRLWRIPNFIWGTAPQPPGVVVGGGGEKFLARKRGELARRGESEMRGFVSCFKSKSNMNIKPKYFLYARKSTEDDDRQVMSIEAQLFELRELARKENLEILEEFQESKSAKTPGRAGGGGKFSAN